MIKWPTNELLLLTKEIQTHLFNKQKQNHKKQSSLN